MFLYLLYMTKYVCDNLCLSLLELCGFPGFNSDTLQKISVTLCRLVNWSELGVVWLLSCCCQLCKTGWEKPMSKLRVVFFVCAKTCLSSVWSAAFYPDHWFPRHSTACHSGRTWQSACGKMDPLLASRLEGTLTTTTNTTPRLDHHHLNQHQIISSNSIINLTIFAHLVATPIFQPLLDSPTHRHLSNMQFCFTPILYFSFSSKF